MMYEHDIFDAAVFGSMLAPRSAIASGVTADGESGTPERQQVDLDALVHQSMLSFNGLMAADKLARVTTMGRDGYRVEFGSQRFAFDMGSFKSLLEQDNEGVDLSFSTDLASYQPEEGLVRKSKVPLWVLRPVGDGRVVLVQRVW